MIILDVDVLIRALVYRVEGIEVDGWVVGVVLVEEVPSGDDAGRHVVQAREWDGRVGDVGGEVATEVRCTGGEGDVTGHCHLYVGYCRE